MKRKNRIIYFVAIALLFFLLAFANMMVEAAPVIRAQNENAAAAPDTSRYQAYSGKIIDKASKQPVVFANVFLEGSSIGTVTNSDGEFLLKIPPRPENTSIAVAHLGYKTLSIQIAELSPQDNVIYIDPATIPIEEVTVRSANPEQLILKALSKRTDNYPTEPVMLTSFYRETIKKNRNYVAVSEAVLDIYKSPYILTLETDRSKIYKGRKSQDVKKMDTVLFKLQGGPYSALLLDLVKHPGEVLSNEFINLYDYKLTGVTYINDRETFVITFKQKPYIPDPLYRGNIYIDVENLAFSGIDFGLNITDPDMVSDLFIRKKPVGMKVEVESANYLTKYRQIDETWYLNYVRLEADFTCKWKRRLFNSRYTTMTEMAVTDMDTANINKFRIREATKMTDVLAEQVSRFEDPDFWGDYNIIKPDESIEQAIEKLSRKLKRRM